MKIAIVFGGCSYEHEISIVSAVVLKKKLALPKLFIFIDKDKDFYLIAEENMQAKYFSEFKYKKSPRLFLGKNGFYLKNMFSSKKLEFAVALNLIHGKDGEDGKLASLFDFYDISYIGPSIAASVLSFNKLYTKAYAKLVGVKTLDYDLLYLNNQDKKLKFDPPFILKPLSLGSSIGIGVVKDMRDFAYAKDIAFEFDDKLLIEPFVENIREFNLAGAKTNGKIVFSIIEEPIKQEYYDFDQKYLSFNEELKNREAKLDEPTKAKFYEAFERIYNNCFENALIRCDFFMLDGEPYLNEINPVPGSMANYLFDDFTALIEALAKEAKTEARINIDYSFIHSISGNKSKL